MPPSIGAVNDYKLTNYDAKVVRTSGIDDNCNCGTPSLTINVGTIDLLTCRHATH